jgi:hypothetical protein
MRIECPSCGMPYDIPDETEVETHLCDCGESIEITEQSG